MVKVERASSSASSNMEHVGRLVSSALQRAVYEKRVVSGVAAAVKELLNQSTSSDSDSDCPDSPGSGFSSSCGGDDVVFCVMAPSAAGDSATHMQSILLEAFCYENDIYIIKVDSAAKLTQALGARTTQTCALIQRPWLDGDRMDDPFDETHLTAAEAAMVDHCEEFWDVPQQPIVQLPD